MGKRLLLLVFCLPGLGFGAPVLRTANEVADFQLHGETGAERSFAVTGRVNQVVGSAVRNQSGILFEVSSGIVDICVIRTAPPSPGDIVAVRGLACINHLREPWFRHVAIDVLGHGPLPEPISVRIEDLSPDRHHLRLVATRGTVVDVQHDDIDSRFDRLYLKDESTLIPVSVLRAPANQDLLDAEVSVRGVYTRNSNGYRKFAGPQIEAFSTNPVAVLRKSVGPFDCPTLEETIYVTPQDLMKLGKRRVTGTVLATWQGDRFLVERSPNHTISVRLDGAEATRRLLASAPDVRVLILTTFGTSDGIARALNAGALGAVLKNADLSELLKAIRTVADGRRFLSAEVEQIMTAEPPLPELSERQLEVLAALARGLPNADVARLLGISLPMVKEHVNAILTKLNVANRTEAVALALRKQLLRA